MVMVVLMVMVVTAGAVTVIMVMMVLRFQFCQICGNTGLTFHCFSQLRTGKLIPGGCYDRSMGISFPKHFHSLVQLLLGDGIRPGHNDRTGSFHLVIIELTEVFAVDLHFTGIHHSNGVAQSHIFIGNLIDSADHIGQLAYTGRLDNDPFRGIIGDHLVQRLAKIAYQTAANTSRIHLGNIDTGILQEPTVNTNLTKFVLDQHQLLSAVMLLDHFFDKCSLAGSQKTGVNIDLSHCDPSFCLKSK